MSEEMKFFIYLLEYYAVYKNKKTGDVFSEWEKSGVLKKYMIIIGYIIQNE